jgi:hypothetical protein
VDIREVNSEVGSSNYSAVQVSAVVDRRKPREVEEELKVGL